MADLSSCYFCGAAMDVSLREYPVVPDALEPAPDDQRTVVLCETCRRKLDRVLDPVVDAVTASARAAADANADAAPNRPMHDTGSPGDDAEAPDDAATPVPPSILSDDDGAAERDTANAERSDVQSDETDDGTPFEVDDTASVFGESVDEAASDGAFADETDATTTSSDAEADDGGTDGIAFGERQSDRASDEPRDDERTDDDRTANDDAADADAAGDAGTDPERPAVDPQTYNKVVRLMKNRDLPVARDEIEAIAGSAYDIPGHECEAIIDAAIRRGLVAADGTDLTDPDGA